MPSTSLDSLAWYDFGKYAQLWVTTVATAPGGAALYRFDGVRPSDYARLEDHARGSWSKSLAKRALAARGQTYGGLRITPSGALDFMDLEGNLIAPLPLSSIAAAALPGRGEVELQLADDIDAGDKEDEMLVEIRFVVPADAELPGISTGGGGGGGGAGAGAGAGGGDDDGDDGRDAAVDLQKRLVEAAGIRGSGSEALVELPEAIGSFMVPRGRFAIEFFPSFLRLVGVNYEFKVTYKSIARIAYLPLPSPTAETYADATKYALVISLDDPLRMGAQRHPHLVLQLEGKQVDAPLHIPAEDIAAGRYEGLGAGGETVLSGLAHKVVGTLFKKITGRPIVKSAIYESARSQRAVKANYKTAPGLLFPLDKSLIYIHKPTLTIRYQDIESVRLSMGSTSAMKTFDCTVVIRAVAGEPRREHSFQQIDKEEFEKLENFFLDRKLNVIVEKASRSNMASEREMEIAAGDGDSDEDEDDEDASGGDDGGGGGGGSDDSGDDSGNSDEEEEEKESSKKRSKPSSKKSSEKSEKSKKSSEKSKAKAAPKSRAKPSTKRAKKDYESDD